jgi:hypothetical protein
MTLVYLPEKWESEACLSFAGWNMQLDVSFRPIPDLDHTIPTSSSGEVWGIGPRRFLGL